MCCKFANKTVCFGLCPRLHDFEIFFNTKIAFAQYGKYIGKLLQYGKFTSKIASNMVSSIEKIAAIFFNFDPI